MVEEPDEEKTLFILGDIPFTDNQISLMCQKCDFPTGSKQTKSSRLIFMAVPYI